MALVELEPLVEPPRTGQGLDALGMSAAMAGALDAAIARRAGLILVAGPAGSGVTTTLRALEARAESMGRRMRAARGAEAPAAGWGDADVLGIGTIDGRESAAAAVRAALDGRVALAGIASASAVEAIGQLRALGVEAYQAAAALTAVVAQRLVRRLCRRCRMPVQARGSVSALLGFDPGTVVFAPDGCDACGGTGYSGHTGVFEGVFPDAALRKLIAKGGDDAILARHAFLNASNLGSAARALVREGATTPDEAVRVSRG